MNATEAATVTPPPARALPLVAGRVLSGLVIIFFLMDAAMKFPPLPVVVDTMGSLGWPTDTGTMRILGGLMIVATALYAYPRTALLGAILMTGYLGGAVATHARIGSPMFSHTLFGVYIGLLAWAGLWLRNPAIRALLPLGGRR